MVDLVWQNADTPGGGGGNTWKAKRWGRKGLSAHGTAAALRGEHRVGAGLAFGGIRRRYGVDDRLSFFMADF